MSRHTANETTRKMASGRSLMALACWLGAVCPIVYAQDVKPAAVPDATTTNFIPRFTSTSGALGNSAMYSKDGSIGIGTASPADTLEVNGSAKVDGNISLSGSILWLTGSAPLIQFSTNGQENFTAGIGAGFNTDSSQNTIIGYEAMHAVTTGSQKTAVGNLALKADTTGFYNTAIGFNSMLANTTGIGNTALGQQALASLTSGQGNLALGQSAGGNLTVETNNMDLANPGVAGDTGVIRIGTASYQNSAFISGIYTSNVSGTPVLVTSSGQLGIAASSRRYKEDIQDMAGASSGLLSLRPVTFRYKQAYADGSSLSNTASSPKKSRKSTRTWWCARPTGRSRR